MTARQLVVGTLSQARHVGRVTRRAGFSTFQLGRIRPQGKGRSDDIFFIKTNLDTSLDWSET